MSENSIKEELKKFFEPLIELSNSESLEDLEMNFQYYGVTIEPYRNILDELVPLFKGLDGLSDRIQVLSEIESIIDALPEIGKIAKIVVLFIQQLNQISISSISDIEIPKIGEDILNMVLLNYISVNYPKVYKFCELLGLIATKISEYNGQREYHQVLNFKSIPGFFNNPLQFFENSYGWGTNDFYAPLFFFNLEEYLKQIRIFPFETEAKQEYLQKLGSTVNSEDSAPRLNVPIKQFFIKETYQEYGISLIHLPSKVNENTSKLALFLYGTAGINQEIKLENGFTIRFKSSADINSDYSIVITPEKIDLIQLSSISNSSPVKFAALLSIVKNSGTEDRMLLLGSQDGTKLEVGSIGLKLGTQIDISPKGVEPDFQIIFPITDGLFAINTSNSDGFLAKVLPEDGINIPFNIAIGWSLSRGIHFEGSAGLEFEIPTHFTLGPIEIINLKAFVGIEDNGLKGAVGTSIGLELGPLALVVENMGISAHFSFDDEMKGNLGPFDVALGFKPPNGIGLSIDATAVKGGGYLFIDTEKGLYYGAAELSIKETVNVTAVGIINTKLPDGSEGYSFLLLISAEFTPIQLGMGFTLSGVGGLVGIHRGMIIEALASGVKNNTLDHILYPENPVANAPAIVASLNSFFPIQQDQFTFGIMLKLGWGTPNLVDIELGLIISLPDPIKIAIVGILKLVLPDAKAPVVKLQVNFIGAIDFGEKYFFFYATLFDSELLIFKVEGSMYFSIEWGSQPYFVFTIGGFHPTFKAPKLRGGIAQEDIKRLQLRLLESDNPKILLEFYFAVTSNTVQFGAALDFKLDLEIFKVLGWFYFDALFQFNPFYFNIQLSAGLQVFIGDSPILGIAFKGMLEGPTPWRIQGYARFSFWFITAEVKINETFGEAPKDLIEPSVEALPILVKALKADGNWQLIKYKSYSDTVLTRGVVVVQEKEDVDTDSATDKTASALIAHPDARVIISQTKIPLNQNIDKIGEQKVLDFSYFKIEADIDGDNTPDNLGTTEDFFAISQYKVLTNEEKLTKSSFELMDSGLEMSSDKLSTGDDTVCTELEYEMQIIDTHGFVEDKQTQKLSALLYNDFTLQNAIHTSVIGKANTLAKLDLIKTATIKKPIPVKDKFHNYGIVDRFDLANAKPITLTAFELAIHEH